MSNPDKPQVVTTRWWWIRHAPVREDNGCIYGQQDLGCDTSDRVVFEAVGKILPRNPVRDVIVAAHGGTIRAAIGLALGGQPGKGLDFDIDNCSVTRLDHIASEGYNAWRLPMVNQQPWIADASHNAMHQPAGPEVAPPATKLA